MAKEATIKTSPDINVNISTDEIARVRGGMIEVDPYLGKRICTKTDNELKAIMDAHLEERASRYP